ncbi:ATPase, AAA family [delta proteobacterium NaphS2]|nr:ATPase, AAA family [delta proteobacterium NaphS2]
MPEGSNIVVPEEDPYFYVTRNMADMLEKIHAISKEQPVNVLISGRQGCGKSSLVRQYAAIYGNPLSVFQVGILSEPGQLFGEYALESGETKYKQFIFPEAIQTPDCVVHLEEINRPEHPKALNMLFSLLSDDREVWIEELGLLKVAKGVVFFATLNEGEEFVGTELLDAALRDRFYLLLMDYLPNEVEKEVLKKKTGITSEQADQIIAAVNFLRSSGELGVGVSTRMTLMIAKMMAVGASLRQALSVSLQVSKERLESVLLSLHIEKGYTEHDNSEFILLTKGFLSKTGSRHNDREQKNQMAGQGR